VEIVRPGVCAVATRGPSRYFGGDEALAAQVAAAVGSVVDGHCRTGVADGPFAAGLAARRGVVVAPGGSPAFLSPFPVAALERPELADLLVRLGIRTLGDFAVLPAADVLGRFGPEGALAHRLARGLDERPPVGREPPPDLVVQAELDPPAQRVDTAAFVGKALADELHGRLAGRGLACTRIAIEAETEHGDRLSRLWRHEGALTAVATAERVRWQLDGWLAGTVAAGAPTGG
jgi:protein ImuB